jgi:hypothetical protein
MGGQPEKRARLGDFASKTSPERERNTPSKSAIELL